jgi:Mor family transcriptional regulator
MTDDHGPIESEHHARMSAIAEALDEVFNGKAKGHDRKIAFVLLVANFGDIAGGRVNYISNGDRADIIAMMKEITARFEGRYSDEEGTA